MTGRTVRDLRSTLKQATQARHDRLDTSVDPGALAGRDGYVEFLSWQYRARVPLEEWALAICPQGLAPPPQCPLIARDLAMLGHGEPQASRFAPPAGAHWLGLAWALGGSALGNKAMRADLRRRGAQWPTAFLASPALAHHFASLMPLLGESSEERATQGAIRAADAVFACFEAARHAPGGRLAA